MFDYHGRVAVITGGSSGLGVLCANALAARGCDVVLAARRFEILEKNARRSASSTVSRQFLSAATSPRKIRSLPRASSWRKNLAAVTS